MKGIRVTAVDLETGETMEQEIQSGNYCLVVAEPLFLTNTMAFRTGTVILTLKREKSS